MDQYANKRERASDSYATLLGLLHEPWMAQALNGGFRGTTIPCVARLIKYLWDLPEGRRAAVEYERLESLTPGYCRLMTASRRCRRVMYAVALAGRGRKLSPIQIDTAVRAVLKLIDVSNDR